MEARLESVSIGFDSRRYRHGRLAWEQSRDSNLWLARFKSGAYRHSHKPSEGATLDVGAA